MGIAREGWWYILPSIILALCVKILISPLWSIPFWLLTLILFYVFRETERIIPPSPLAIVSPVDGVVTKVEKGTDLYLQRNSVTVVVCVNALGEFGIRGPIEGKIQTQWLIQQGEKIPLDDTQRKQTYASEKPLDHSTYSLWIETDEQDDLVISMPLRRWPKPAWYAHVGERVGQGQRCGYITFGGTIELMLPENARLKVKEGDKVRSGSDILALFVHDKKT